MIKLYKILTFLLQPVAYMLLMMSVSSLVMSGLNPQFLLFGAVGVCIFIYAFLCFRFTAKGIIGNQPLKAKLKDWIKVNSYVTLLQAVFMLFAVVMALYVIPKNTFDTTFKTMYEMVQQQGQQDVGSYEAFTKYMRTMFGVVGIIELVLLVHIFLTWRVLKAYREYFSE